MVVMAAVIASDCPCDTWPPNQWSTTHLTSSVTTVFNHPWLKSVFRVASAGAATWALVTM